MAPRRNKTLNVHGALSLNEAVNHVLDGIRKLQTERDGFSAEVVRVRDESEARARDLCADRDAFATKCDQLTSKLKALTPVIPGSYSVQPEDLTPLNAASLADWRCVVEGKDKEIAALKEQRDHFESQLDEVTKERGEAKRMEEAADEDKDNAARDAYRHDLLTLARWIFSLGGTFPDVASVVQSAEGNAIVQLAYLAGSHEIFDAGEISAQGNHAGIFKALP